MVIFPPETVMETFVTESVDLAKYPVVVIGVAVTLISLNLFMGKTTEEAIEWGKRQAASVVSFMGPKKGLMTREEIEK